MSSDGNNWHAGVVERRRSKSTVCGSVHSGARQYLCGVSFWGSGLCLVEQQCATRVKCRAAGGGGLRVQLGSGWLLAGDGPVWLGPRLGNWFASRATNRGKWRAGTVDAGCLALVLAAQMRAMFHVKQSARTPHVVNGAGVSVGRPVQFGKRESVILGAFGWTR